MTKKQKQKYLWRAFDSVPDTSGRSYVHYERYHIVRHTPKGAWIETGDLYRKFVWRCKNPYAHATPEEALEALLKRREAEEWHLRRRLYAIPTRLRAIKNAMEHPEDVLGMCCTNYVPLFPPRKTKNENT